MEKEKKTQLHNISLWIVITAVPISQLLNLQINLRLMQKLQSQEKAIHQLIDLHEECANIHSEAYGILVHYSGDSEE